jgi:hypothetical protein
MFFCSFDVEFACGPAIRALVHLRDGTSGIVALDVLPRIAQFTKHCSSVIIAEAADAFDHGRVFVVVASVGVRRVAVGGVR